MTPDEKNTDATDLQDLRDKVSKLEGEKDAIKQIGGAFLALVITFMGYETLVGINKRVDAIVEKAVKDAIKEEKSNIILGIKDIRELGRENVKKLEAELALMQDAAKENVKTFSTNIQVYDKTNSQNLQDFRKLRTEASDMLLELKSQIAEAKVAIASIDGDNLANISPTNRPVRYSTNILFENTSVKKGYFLPLGSAIQLNVDKVSADVGECKTRLSWDEDRTIVFNKDKRNETVVVNGNKLDITLEKVGSAGLNPFTKACFFTVTSTPVMESKG